MALTQQQRSEIYGRLTDAVGQPGAEYLMAQQPPGGWEQLATKRDLADLEVKTHASFVELNAKMEIGFAAADAKMEKGFAAADAKIETGFAAADAKMEKGFAEVKEQFAEVKEQFAEVKEQFASIDTRFAELSGRRSRDVWAFITAITVMTVSICGSVFVSVWQFTPA